MIYIGIYIYMYTCMSTRNPFANAAWPALSCQCSLDVIRIVSDYLQKCNDEMLSRGRRPTFSEQISTRYCARRGL